jgi:LPXTG-motif cell wall-anchored protein
VSLPRTGTDSTLTSLLTATLLLLGGLVITRLARAR